MTGQRKGHGILNISMFNHQGKSGVLFLIFTFLSVISFCPEILGASKSLRTGNPIVGTIPQQVEDIFIQNPNDFVVETFAENLEVPWELVFLPDGRELVAERPGRIRMIDKGKLLDTPYTSIGDTR